MTGSANHPTPTGHPSNGGEALPKLRFPEFREAGGWQEKTLGEVLTFQAGFPFDSANFTEERDGLRLIRNRDLKSDDKIIFYSNSFDEKFVVNDGDVLVGMDGDFTPCVWNKGKALLNQRVGRILPNSNSSQRFLFYFLTVHLRAIEEATARTTVKHLSHSVVERIHEPLPAFPEQQKIADCLASLDERITSEAQKLVTLKTHKKGLMQRLFPAEGETLPKLRFPEFLNKGAWEVKELGHLATYTKGFAFKSQDYRNEGLRIIRVSDLGVDLIKSDNEKIFVATESAADYKNYKLNKAEIIITTVGSKPELVDSAVGRGIYVSTSNAGLLNQNLLKLEAMAGVNSKFLFSNINTKEYQRFIASISRGNANQANIAVKELMKYELKVPGLDEQQKIADCLASLDDLITAQTQKLATLKTHKKGLMQQLFPVLDEATQ